MIDCELLAHAIIIFVFSGKEIAIRFKYSCHG